MKNKKIIYYGSLAFLLLVCLLALVYATGNRGADDTGQNNSTEVGGNNLNNPGEDDDGSIPTKENRIDQDSSQEIKTSAELTKVNVTDGYLVISTRVVGFVSGRCELTISNSSGSSTHKARLMFAPEFSTCEGYSISVNELTQFSNQTVQLKLRVIDNEAELYSDTKEISIP